MTNIDFHLYVITNRWLCKTKTLPEIIQEICTAGVKAIQLREKDLPARSVYALANKCKKLCRQTATKLILNERFDLARAARTDGVHLTSKSIPPGIVKEHLSASQLMGVSTHSADEAKRAEHAKADYILFGPVYKTPAKTAYGEPQGLAKLSDVATSVEIPVFAVGGITPERSRACLDHGARGVAVISSVIAANNIRSVIENYRKHLGKL